MTEETYFAIKARHSDYDEHWLTKSGRRARGGLWVVDLRKEIAKRLDTLSQAKTALKSISVRKLKKDGWSFSVMKVKVSYKERKVFPLSALEALAQTAS